MPREDFFLSKSKYLTGLQCPKLLWMQYNDKEKIPPPDAETQAKFDQGHKTTELSHALFPGGVEVKGPHDDYEGVLAETQKLLSLKKPLYEAAFKYKRTFSRADILKPNKDGSWDIFEVKSAASVKDINYYDVGFQKYCYEGAGLKIGKVYVVYINNQYVKDGPIDPEELFTQEDVTEKAQEFSELTENQIDKMVEIIQQKKCPEIKIGLQCSDPYDCSLIDHCWSFLPKESVFKLNNIRKKKAFEIIEEGILALKDMKEDHPFTVNQRIQWEAHCKNKVYIRSADVKSFIDKLEFPVYFLDFETINPAIPVYDQSRPFQQVPFQYSLHILSDWDKSPVHHAFLSNEKDDPRPELLSRLKSLLGAKGNVLSYNMNFELGCLEDAVGIYPEYNEWFKEIRKRYLDPMVIFKNFDYYDPKQMGRYSIKNVYPALTGGTYEGMEIGDGGTASREYARVMFSEGISPDDKDRVLRGLEEYCKLDTQAMIDILGVLKKAINNKN